MTIDPGVTVPNPLCFLCKPKTIKGHSFPDVEMSHENMVNQSIENKTGLTARLYFLKFVYPLNIYRL